MARRRGGGLSYPIVVCIAFACVCLLAASMPAASGAADRASSKAKRAKACKKKHKRAACKKRAPQRAPGQSVPRTVTLTWDSGANIDLQVYDLDGRHAGREGGGIVNGIPGATHSGDDTDGFGPETFSDPSGRRVGYLACYVSGPQANVTLVDSGNGGGVYTATLGPAPGSSAAYSSGMGWGYLPIGADC